MKETMRFIIWTLSFLFIFFKPMLAKLNFTPSLMRPEYKKFDVLIPIAKERQGQVMIVAEFNDSGAHRTSFKELQNEAEIPLVAMDLRFLLNALSNYKIREEAWKPSDETALLGIGGYDLTIAESEERKLVTLDPRYPKNIVLWPSKMEFEKALLIFNLSIVDRPGMHSLGLLDLSNVIVVVEEQKQSESRHVNNAKHVFSRTSLLSKHPSVVMLFATGKVKHGVMEYGVIQHKFNLEDDQLSSANFVWRQSQMLRPKKELVPPISDYNGLAFRATTVPRAHACITQDLYRGKWGIEGNEERAVSLLAKHLNVNRSFLRTPKGHFGVLDKDEWTGMLGQLRKDEADAAMCTMSWLSIRSTTFAPTLFPRGENVRTFVAPLPKPFPLVFAIVTPFRLWVWIALLVTFVAFVTVLKAVNNTRNLEEEDGLLFCIATLLRESCLHQSRGVRDNSMRWLLLLWLCGCLIVSNSYSGELCSYLSRPGFSAPLDTMDDLMDSDIAWAWAKEGRAIEEGLKKGAFKGRTIQRLWDSRSSFEHKPDTDGINLEPTIRGEVAVIEVSIELEYIIATKYSTISGLPLVHLSQGMREMPRPLFWHLQRLNPFSPRFSFMLRLFGDHGILMRDEQDVLREAALKIVENGHTKGWLQQRPNPSPTTVSDLYGAMAITITLWVMSASIFVHEIWQSACALVKRWQEKRKLEKEVKETCQLVEVV